jgi:hypothetical protein
VFSLFDLNEFSEGFGGYDFFCEFWFSLIISSLPEKKSGNFSFSFGSELGSTQPRNTLSI